MNIKYSELVSFLERGKNLVNDDIFIKNIEKQLNEKLVSSELSDYDCDIKLIYIKSGGTENLFLEHINDFKEPYYFLASGENNSLAATLEICTYLSQQNKQFKILHGDITDICSQIVNLRQKSVLKEIEKVNKVIEPIKTEMTIEQIKQRLSGTKLGVIGKPSDWLISSIPDYNKIKDVFNIELVDIPLQELTDNYKIDYENNFKFIFDKTELAKASGIHNTLLNIVAKYKLDGFSIRCFDLLNTLKSTCCLSLGLLNEDGVIASCEGDIMAMISMRIANLITGSSSFQANPCHIDNKTNEITFAHCTVPLNMVSNTQLMTHFESQIGVAIRGKLKEQDVTIFRLSADLKNYFVSEGKIIQNLEENNLCRTQIKVKLNENVDKLLEKPCGNHHIIFYGKRKDIIDLLMKNYIR